MQKFIFKSLALFATAILILAAGCNSQKENPAPATQPGAKAPVSGGGTQTPTEQTPDPPASTSAPAASVCESAANPKHCFFSDPFTVTIVNIDHTLNAYHTIRMNIEFRNAGKAPVTLAYQWGTGKGVDDLGNGYAVKIVPTGIPTDYGTKTDARLTLQPGEAHMGAFEAGGYRTPKDPATFNYDFTIDELGSDKPAQVLREHAVYFRDLTPAMPSGATK